MEARFPAFLKNPKVCLASLHGSCHLRWNELSSLPQSPPYLIVLSQLMRPTYFTCLASEGIFDFVTFELD